MASTSESGHAKTVANFEDLLSFCTAYGTSYNPSRAAIQLTALSTLQTNAQASLAAVTSAKIALGSAVNARQAAFEPLKRLSTRILNALDATDATPKLVKDARSINLKIQGRRLTEKSSSTAPTTSETAEDKSISVSQQSYDSLIENFDRLIQLVGNEPSYSPNETELQVSTLNTTLGALRTANTAVISAFTTYSNVRITRNAILYGPTNGLVTLAGDVKKYVKSVFGASSPEFKQITGIQFRVTK
jgi:hypothetical protein